ncbi:MAG TPA: cytochrome c [Verrucomicrobiae bacterium]|nr:cytochrome c [Verrucomicrobiae bacterium]
MKAAVWLALAALPAPGQVGGGQVAPFGVYTKFEKEPSPAVLRSLKQELNSIMSLAGWRVEWRSLASHPQGEAFTQLAVVTFKGSCEVSFLAIERVETGALGWTHMASNEVQPYSEINCEYIRAFLSRSLYPLWPQDREYVFGRAVARVLAHELYHVFTKTPHHGASGVAEATFTAPELMADEFSFSDADQHALMALFLAQRPGDAATMRAAGESVFVRGGCVSCHGEKGGGTALAPAVRPTSANLSPRQLAAKLATKASSMFKRAKEKNIAWHLDSADIESLLVYLSSQAE